MRLLGWGVLRLVFGFCLFMFVLFVGLLFCVLVCSLWCFCLCGCGVWV